MIKQSLPATNVTLEEHSGMRNGTSRSSVARLCGVSRRLLEREPFGKVRDRAVGAKMTRAIPQTMPDMQLQNGPTRRSHTV